ncbi:S49 family peptidase [Rhizobium sp. Leaf341]|uniref:S49 family peptidase n=1 Tax=Rhizobium sp. Leaf341 TaxID=1736344 RepID=UPI0009EC2EC4|nr:S49 family peptidase [Rhizobium sp. Leaf341]
MRYAHIMAALMEERWAIDKNKLQLMLDFMSDQSSGIKYDADDVAARIGARPQAAAKSKQGVVAIIGLRGVISNRMSMMGDISGGTSTEAFGKVFKDAIADDGVKAIIIDTDSGGGAVSGVDELSSLIYASRSKKTIIAHVNAVAASAAYWICSAASEVVITPSGMVGSIGVFTIRDDVSGALEKAGIRKTIISAGERKVDGNPYSAMSDDVRDRIQQRINDAYDMFVSAVARNRGVSVAVVREKFGKGDIVVARPALAVGMVDRIETLDATIQRLHETNYELPRRPAPSRDLRKSELDQGERLAALRVKLESETPLLQLRGYATVFDSVGTISHYGPMEYAAGAFPADLCAPLVIDHDMKHKVSPSHRVSIKRDAKGLFMVCDIHADAAGRATLETYLRGRKSLSISAKPTKSVSRMAGADKVMRVVEAHLMEVSLVDHGAFKGTNATLHAMNGLDLGTAVARVKAGALAEV